MMRVREPRFWTALVVMGLSVFTIARSITLLRFGLEELVVDRSSPAAVLTPFEADPAIGYLARRDALALDRGENAKEKAAAASALLTATPLSGAVWLDLARARLGAGEGMAKVAGALVMSDLTVPNEARVMAARAVFGLPLWALSTPEARKSLVADLVGGWDETTVAERQALRAVFRAARAERREAVRARLLLLGKEAAPIAGALGLEPPPAR